MEHEEPPFGFWIPVKDHASANYAAKMSGLPVFLMGLSFVFLGGLFLIENKFSAQGLYNLITVLGGLFLIFSGLQIRKLKFKTLPISIAIWLGLNLLGFMVAGFGIGSILTLLIGILAISGLRGWYWLREHPADEGVFDMTGTKPASFISRLT